MDFFNVLTMVGGLAFFLYGMDTMSHNLRQISGSKIQSIMQALTSNVFKALALGIGITALLQTSSGTTVIVVGLVNAGIMQLSQAIVVIMGANIGTTITSWILSLASISSDNFFLRMLKPKSFSPIFALVGVFLIIFSKKQKTKNLGKILVGFAILMFGMEIMGGAMKPLAQVPEFIELFTIFSNPILGIIAGAILTAVIQSSSASVGILQALSATGAINFSSVLSIIMGQNIGTCATAMLSTIGAKKNAKRAATVHLLFNLFGTVIFMAGFYIIHAIRPFAFMDSQANAFGIAVVHTSFNVITTIVLLPMRNVLESLTKKLVPATKDRFDVYEEFARLDERLLATPSIALDQCYYLAGIMFELSKKNLEDSVDLIKNFDHKKFDEIKDLEARIDRYEDRLGTYLVSMPSLKSNVKLNRKLTFLLYSISDIERIGDLALNIAQAAEQMSEENLVFTEQALNELEIYSSATKEIVSNSLEVFKNSDMDKAVLIEPLEEVIDELHDSIKDRHIGRLKAGICSVDSGLVLSDITTSLERIADHCSNIAVKMIEVNLDVFEIHQYLHEVKRLNPQFRMEYKKYKNLYRFPERQEVENFSEMQTI